MENKKITLASSDKCCGCSACFSICPKQAISMQENKEGFLQPVIDETKCIRCGKCQNVCPVLKPVYKNNTEPQCYAAMANDDIRMKSSSGGVFTLLAEYVLDKGGYVCGAAYDDNWMVHHIIIDKKEDLDKIRGSKYLQSSMDNCYQEIKDLLQKNNWVLFSGTPCQVAGLYSFLGKDYEKLLTVDIFCHGAPSRSIWKKYLSETFEQKNIKNINFRDKSKIGWSCSHCVITLNNEEKIITDDFTKMFHNSTLLNQACENCSFSKLFRPADISIGDWWGISDYIKGVNDGKGISIVLINNKKGNDIFQKVVLNPIPINLSNDYNNGHIKHGPELNNQRKRFFDLIKKHSYKQTKEIILENRYDVCLLTTFFAKNFGAILVAYAANQLITSLGKTVLMLQKLSNVWTHYPNKGTMPMNFAEKHYCLSKVYNNVNELYFLNNHIDNFVVGSDQLFKPRLYQEPIWLDFVYAYKNKISFATSFGDDVFSADAITTEKRKYSLKRFNHIALREYCPNLCENVFQVQADEVMDPTLILPLENYINLQKDIDLGIKDKFLVTYLLDATPQKAKAVNYIAKQLNLKVINIPNPEERDCKQVDGLEYRYNTTPEEFLWLYNHASFVVTDSYHGTCFSVKFNKPFVSLLNKNRGGLRYKLFNELKVSDRILTNIDDIYTTDIFKQDIDYTKTNEVMKHKAEYAINWLKNALENNTSSQKFSDMDIYLDIRQKQLEEKSFAQYNNLLRIVKESNLIHFKKDMTYYRYKLLSKITFGKKKKHYKRKYKELKQKIKQIKK